MQKTLIFVTLLFTVSCNIDTSSESAFIQLTKDARAEAVLATVAIQMQQNNGFEKVQSLLSELLNTARENLHSNQMLNQKASARCDVYNHKLSERSSYLSAVVESLVAEKATVVEATKNAGEALKSRIALSKVYAGLDTSEKARYSTESTFYSGLKNTINEALSSVNDISAKLKSNAPPTPSFVQTSIKKVTDSYQKVFNVNIDLPESFVQMSIDNNAAKKRIIAWLDDIKMTFSSMVTSITEDSKTRSDNNGKFSALLEKIVEALKTENANIAMITKKYAGLSTSYDENIASFDGFRTKNVENLKENTDYCTTESAAYEKVKANSQSNVKIYEELMNYFLENYRKISKMINDKYKVIKD